MSKICLGGIRMNVNSMVISVSCVPDPIWFDVFDYFVKSSSLSIGE